MSHLSLTILLAIIVMGIAVTALGIGLLITGKSKLHKGCGYRPGKDKNSCDLCGDKDKCNKEKEKDDN